LPRRCTGQSGVQGTDGSDTAGSAERRYRNALALDEVAVNPTTGVQLPAVRGRRERIASPPEPLGVP
jgi:hypothetical protein